MAEWVASCDGMIPRKSEIAGLADRADGCQVSGAASFFLGWKFPVEYSIGVEASQRSGRQPGQKWGRERTWR
ncbi:MAG: hypothetical protein WCO26_20200 [Deltaproteobacteria bacterium]